MKYPLLRRFRLAELDREVARASMQICHKIVMQQLYISRADVRRQWVVISNPSEEAIDLTGYSVASTDGSSMFRFPRKYTLLAGDQVTIWCSPGGVDLDTDNVLEPYLFWTEAGGSLRNAPFFTPDTINEVLLLDPMMTEVASLKIYEDGRKEFRVLNCVSQHARSASGAAQFCVGCLSPPPALLERQSSSRMSPSPPQQQQLQGGGVYVFSRYWDVVSDKSLFAHFLGLLLAPLVECLRALLIYLLLSLFQTQRTADTASASASASFAAVVTAAPVGIALGPQLRTKLLRIAVLMTACDVLTRRLTLWIKSGLLVTVMSAASVLLDQLALVALYTSLERVYPTLAIAFRRLLCLELGIATLNMAALQLGFLEVRSEWHPAFQELARWDFHGRYTVFLCGAGKELLIHLLLLLPLQTQPSLVATLLAYGLVPLFTVSTGMDFVRGIATLLHLLQHPWRRAARRRGAGTRRLKFH